MMGCNFSGLPGWICAAQEPEFRKLLGNMHPVFRGWAMLEIVLLWLPYLVGISDAWQGSAAQAVG
jgi:hypothetical protein